MTIESLLDLNPFGRVAAGGEIPPLVRISSGITVTSGNLAGILKINTLYLKQGKITISIIPVSVVQLVRTSSIKRVVMSLSPD